MAEEKKYNCSVGVKNLGSAECMPFEMQKDIFLHMLSIDENGNVYDFLCKNIIGWYINGPNNRIRCKLYDSEIRFNCNIQRKSTSQDIKTLKYSVINANYE